MNTNHNRIKVSDLETDDPDKILVTNSNGELEFIATKNIKVDSYNALDYDQEGKALDARQGKILKDLVNNKTDKGGFQGTAQDLANSIPDLNAANLKLGGYPNTRNDGQLPTNKILSTDANGNLRLYTIPISPAPYISELIPDSYLPNSTGDILIHGDFFTPQMCDRVTNPNAIIIEGVTTIHYATFISSQLIKINVTTGSAEGNFSCTLNNGLSTTKDNALFITYGSVFKPAKEDWTVLVGNPDLSQSGEVHLNVLNTSNIAKIKTTFFTPSTTGDFIMFWNWSRSPLGNPSLSGYNYNRQYVKLTRVSDNVDIYLIGMTDMHDNHLQLGFFDYLGAGSQLSNNFLHEELSVQWAFKRISGNYFIFRNGVPFRNITYHEATPMYITIGCWGVDVTNIKLINL